MGTELELRALLRPAVEDIAVCIAVGQQARGVDVQAVVAANTDRKGMRYIYACLESLRWLAMM